MFTKAIKRAIIYGGVSVAASGYFASASCDAARPWQLMFQDPATPVMEGVIDFHNDLMFVVVFVGIFVGYVLMRCVQLYTSDVHPVPNRVQHGTLLEIVWTVTPALILMSVAIPSFALLYSVDEIIDPAVTLKAVGHQWYWSYEYSDYAALTEKVLNFDSYMIPEDDFLDDPTTDTITCVYRLLEVDNRIVVPINTHIRVLVTSGDVLHCWAIPSFGIKIDACPGRLNQTTLFLKREGTYYGQCSEICGVNHGFMPITVQAVTLENYLSWIIEKLEIEV
jgi:cytochrome c oxidase subunit 2